MESAHAWEEEVPIPTYPAGEPLPYPMFLEKRVYQGSSGRVYPHPVIDSVSDEKEDRRYKAVFLENEYLKIMLLPELGGRVQMALDKTNGYHFVYYNRVIKPALVGLAGPWISGGIEFNWPQHHRPSTFQSVEYAIEEGNDGSATVWMHEIERMSRTRGLAGFTLRPGCAYLEIEGRLYNRTPLEQTFLWWANPAVSVNDEYQSVFPPDVHAVFDHGKRDVSRFPIATGSYYKVDYSAGVDISRYANIPVPTSYMAYHSDFDFVGGYDHGRGAGILHVADHRVSPGKKQWTWGTSDFGKAWERNLTDADGPYIELMTGVFTDNQPDFSWLDPGEEKSFVQYFMPYKDMPRVRCANLNAVVDLEVAGPKEAPVARLGLYSPARRRLGLRLLRDEVELFGKDLDASPAAATRFEVSLPPQTRAEDLVLLVEDEEGHELLCYREGEKKGRPVPEAARPAPPPADATTNEELFLIGLHLEQYRHATYRPEDYWEEALRRDPRDIRCTTALGRLALRRGQHAKALGLLQTAVARWTSRNGNPPDGEAHYLLGLCLAALGRDEEAQDALSKATWNQATKPQAYFQLARLASRRGERAEGLRLAEECLAFNGRFELAADLRIFLLRSLGRAAEAKAREAEVLRRNPLNLTLLAERAFRGAARDAAPNAVGDAGPALEAWWAGPARRNGSALLEVMLEYAEAGFTAEALALASLAETAMEADPFPLYYAGLLSGRSGDAARAETLFRRAEGVVCRRRFPNQVELAPAFEAAAAALGRAARADYYRGCLLYDKRRYDEAGEAWRRSAEADPDDPRPPRNLAIYYFNKKAYPEAARAALSAALAAAPRDARLLYESDLLDKKMNVEPAIRLERLAAAGELAQSRDDLRLEKAALLNLALRHGEALDLILARRFHPWEGGEGRVPEEYRNALVGLARSSLAAGKPREALGLLERAKTYPESLGEGRLPNAADNEVDYWRGLALAALGQDASAAAAWEEAAVGEERPALTMYYNDRPADSIYYQGLAQRRLGREEKARGRFRLLRDYGETHAAERPAIDYFAVSLPDFLIFDEDLGRRNLVFCRYLQGLAALGLGDPARAESLLDEANRLDRSHYGVHLHLALAREAAADGAKAAALRGDNPR